MQVSVESYKKILSDSSIYKSMTMKTNRKELKVRDFNDAISCYLCNGYIINPTTVDNCLHSYCRSCIVQHLLNESFCPQCKSSGGKHISVSNLKSDDVLRTFIYKLVPGLYQNERERIVQFTADIRNDQQQLEEKNKCRELELEEDLFLPAEPISLSLEYHPALSKDLDLDHIPPVRYLQCPAGLKIFHLKRFLCSKYDINPDNKRIEVDVIYEEEVLPNDFTLMDVGYCYNWKRHAPMKFRYRILIHSGEVQNNEICQSNVNEVCTESANSIQNQESITPQIDNSNLNANGKLVSIVNDNANVPAPTLTKTTLKSEALTPSHSAVISSSSSSSKTKASKAIETKESQDQTAIADVSGGLVKNAPVKVIIARKSSYDSKKQSPKQSSSYEETATYAITSDFKSLRSNDIRYSDYAVTSTTTTANTPARNTKPKSCSQQKSPDESSKVVGGGESVQVVPKCDIVVSIPHSQMPKSPYSLDEQFENVSLAQLKTASKKSPPNSSAVYEPVKKPKNVPKLKIELNSLKTKLTIPKPKSADLHRENVDRKKLKYRKHSLDELGPTADKVDLETYAKIIGLKPIEVLTPAESDRELNEKLKFSPNASPMSSSSSTNSSSNGNNFVLTSSPKISSSVHKKRKKKHSNGKRRKLHAEISSQPADESLKMKVKITASHNHKAHKSESRKSEEGSKTHTSKSSSSSESSLDCLAVLNKTLREESKSINNLMKHKPDKVQAKYIATTDETNSKSSSSMPSTSTKSFIVLKPISSIKDINKIPSSPPLPPSLFKTTALTLTTLTPATSTLTSQKLTSVKEPKSHEDSQELSLSTSLHLPSTSPSQQHSKKSSTSIEKKSSNTTTTTTPTNTIATNHKNQHFAVPNPPRPISNIQRLFSTPSSIASAANKQVGMQLKRSASLDESYSSATATKQKKIEQDRAMRKSAYGSYMGNAHMSSVKHQNQHQSNVSHKQQKISISSSVGRSFELPVYSPMSSAYSQEYTKRKVASSVTPSPISICKVSDSPYNVHTQHNSTSGAVTITARKRPTTMPYSQQHALNKPALEIVRITSNQIPADMLPLPPLSAPKGNHHRLMGPPAPVAKIKRPGQQSLSLSVQASTFLKPPTSSSHATSVKHKSSSPSSTHSSTYRTSPPALVNLHNIFPSKSCISADSNSKKTEVGPKASSDSADKPKPNLREFRPTSKDGSVDILDLSPAKIQETLTTQPSKVVQSASSPLTSPPNGNSLEAALNKMKQNISSCTVASDNKHTSATKKLTNTETNSDDLQNLHMLSESATAREKIDIKTQLYDSQKLKQSSVVRQQNASVRSIPNPSALAFRNQPTTLPVLSLTSASPSQPQKKAHLPLTAATTPTELVTTSPSPRSIMKKPTTIDQVATNLNIRAAAAEASAAKAASASEELEPVQVTSTSNSTNNNTDEKQRNSSKSCNNVDALTTSISAAASAGSIKSSLLETKQLVKSCISNIATPNTDCASSVASSV